MRSGIDIQTVIWLAAICAGFLTVGKLYWTGLHRVYRFFWLYLGLRTGRSGVLYFLDRPAYSKLWVWTQPAFWVLYVLIVLELYSLVFRDFPGIYTVSRRVLAAGLAIGVAVSGATFWFTTPAPDKAALIQYYTLVERGVVLSLVVFLLVLVAFLAWYPVPLRRNALAHTVVYCVYFTTIAAVLLVRNVVGPLVHPAVNIGLLATSALCTLGWLILFSRDGETRKSSLRSRVPPGDAARALEQLSALNRSLTRARPEST